MSQWVAQQPNPQETDGWMLIESPSVGRLLEEVAGPYPMCAWNWGWGYQGDSINMVRLTEYTFMGVSNIKVTCFF